MNKFVLTLSAVVALAAAQAQAETVIEDADGNGTHSIAEMQAAYPDMTEEAFAAADANADGEIDADELAAARAAGTVAE